MRKSTRKILNGAVAEAEPIIEEDDLEQDNLSDNSLSEQSLRIETNKPVTKFQPQAPIA